MKTKRTKLTITALAILLFCGMAQTTLAQNVDVRLSAREAYVGMPVVLQIAISNASDYQEPTLPRIDGCDVQSAGAPSQSSQITIINGRRSENRSVTMQYLITPRREGTFEIPPLTLKVNGRDQKTEPVRFVATKSQTGDLLFVEIEGGKEKVFVGQPLDLTLKIWIKPFVDREKNIKLSEANMWQMISGQTSWGSFGQRLKEMAENNQRPAGRDVLRDDGNGAEREYFLYEIEGTVYPKRAGKIDASDVQIVVSYPTALGKSRDPFESFFKGSPFGGSSRLSRMMDDDFFGGSPFGNRLSVTSTRPIVGEAAVDSTQVVPVPTAGRPADYRGAVGRYKIVTQATPTAVSAGDPITLNIGIIGTGPMELVQAPPLAELSSLTVDFKVEEQALAGFVKDETKVFPTAIRPRRAGIAQIPGIPFSFFDPDTETFETVVSEPISITVDKSESLALDAIVGNSRRHSNENGDSTTVSKSLEPNFTNDHAASLLVSQAPGTSTQWWWTFVVVPPFVWLGTLIVRNRDAVAKHLPSFKSTEAQCLAAIDRAKNRTQIENSLIRYISRRTEFNSVPTRSEGRPANAADPASTNRVGMTTSSAVGALRTSGFYQIANEVESFFQNCEHSAFSGSVEQSLVEIQSQAKELTEKMETAFASMSKSQVRRSNERRKTSTGNANVRPVARAVRKASMLLLVALSAFSANMVVAGDVNASAGGQNHVQLSHVQLSKSQQRTILEEAGEIYAGAIAVGETDSAEANDLFMSAAAKYQLLVDSGVQNSGLYLNLGNACLQSNQLGRAIANYERAIRLDPTNRQLNVNWELANSLVEGKPAKSDIAAHPTSFQTVDQRLRSANEFVINVIGMRSIIWTLVLSSLVFWGIFITRATGYSVPGKRWAIVPLCFFAISLTSVALTATQPQDSANAIIVAKNVILRAGDGEQFPAVASLGAAQGHRVQTLAHRGWWTQIKTSEGHVGWMEDKQLENL